MLVAVSAGDASTGESRTAESAAGVMEGIVPCDTRPMRGLASFPFGGHAFDAVDFKGDP